MKTKLIPFLLFITLNCTNCLAQSNCDTIYDSKEIKAHYKKGERELNKFVIKQLLPIIGQCQEKETSIISSLFMYLTIDSKGKIVDVRITRAKLSETCKAELKKELLTMKGWQPAILNNQPVCSIYLLPIHCCKRE
ncbi:hypothetical protein [Flavobacterium sp. J27]|uniref:hypothetical protein n=1 Tax=Flavobacterium sp. J27 TaxID=2060419 RepID=UPI001030BBCC|nr:hypothetical protein [Flavobacterium sp. J27]